MVLGAGKGTASQFQGHTTTTMKMLVRSGAETLQVVEHWFPQGVYCIGFKKEKISELSNFNILTINIQCSYANDNLILPVETSRSRILCGLEISWVLLPKL